MKLLKRVISLSLTLILAFSAMALIPASAATETAISSYEEFCNIANDLDGNYYLTGDITVKAGDKAFTALGSATSQFKGTLDGRGHSIIGININATKSQNGSSNYGGIFAYNGGTVKNLNVVNATVTASGTKYAYGGVIAAINLGTIENCYVSGSVTNSDITVANYTGGISGEMLRGSIKNCVSYANVYAKGAEQYTGGITGYNERGDIANTAMYGSVFANGVDASTNVYLGGITGFARNDATFNNLLFAGGVIAEKFADVYLGGILGNTLSKVNNCVAIGTVTPSEILSHIYIGGIAGNDYSATVKNTYYLKGIINEDITCKTGTELTESGIANAASFSGLNFSDVWEIKDGKPALRNLPTVATADEIVSKLTGIKITSKPTKLEYTQGDPALDLTGLKVSAVYTDKTAELKQNEYTVGGYNYVKSGKQTITVSYKGFTAEFTINVKKTEAGVIIPEITDGSYYEGDSNGKVTESSKPSTTSKKQETTSSTTSYVEIGGNVVEDTMEDDEGNVTSSNPSSSTASTVNGSNIQNAIDGTSSVSDGSEKGKPPVVLIVVLAVLVVAVAAAAIVFLTKRKNEKPAESVAETTEENKTE